MALADLQRLLADALPRRDPYAELRESPVDGLSPQESIAVQRLSEDGLLLTSLVLVKLRMQQLLKSHAESASLFEVDPAAFVHLFEEYHTNCPMADYFPEGEAQRFVNWLERRQVVVASPSHGG